MGDPTTCTAPPTSGLTAPVSPRFFAGQLLTDRDLSALEDWVRTRLRFARYRDGWGVACGLEVQSVDAQPTAVRVTPGYALDACGNDLVYDDDKPVVLPTASDTLAGPCPYPMQPPKKGEAPAALPFSAGPWELENLGNVQVFDLLLQYKPVDDDPVTALLERGARRCEYSRTRESARPYFVARSWLELGLVTARTAPGSTSNLARKLLADFQADPTVNALFDSPNGVLPQVMIKGNPPFKLVQDWIQAQIKAHQVLTRTFPTLLEKVLAGGADELGTPWGVARFLFWMVDAARQAEGSCPTCCPPDAGAVPLARLWTERVGNLYKIRVVDATWPYRRPLRGGPLSAAPDDAWDPSTYLGRRWEDVVQALARLGVQAEAESFELPSDGEHLLALLNEETEGTGPLLAANQRVIAIVSARLHPSPAQPGDGPAAPEPLAGRVVAFRRPSVVEIRPPVTTVDTTYEVALYQGTSGVSPPAFGPKPSDSEKLVDVSALPSGATVKIVASVAHADFSPGSLTKSYAYQYHDAIDNEIKSIGGVAPTGGDATIVTTIQLPDAPTDRPSIPVTFLVEESITAASGTKVRKLALTDALRTLDKDRKPQVVQVVNEPFKPATRAPRLKVVPLAASKDKTAVAVKGGKLPVVIRMNNDSPSPIQGELRFGTAAPASVAAMDSTGTVVGRVRKKPFRRDDEEDVDVASSFVGPIVALDAASPGVLSPFFWLRDGTDAFQRGFKIGPAVTQQYVLELKNVLIEVKNEDAGGVKKPKLQITNNETAAITVSKIQVASDDNFSSPLPFALGAPVTIAGGASHDFGFIGTIVRTSWRVLVEFQIGGGPAPAQLSAVVEVAAVTV